MWTPEHRRAADWRGLRQAGRNASPTAAIIDSQSTKAAQKKGASIDPQGFDAAKKVTGRKRHVRWTAPEDAVL